jgi:hypothetical protein
MKGKKQANRLGKDSNPGNPDYPRGFSVYFDPQPYDVRGIYE